MRTLAVIVVLTNLYVQQTVAQQAGDQSDSLSSYLKFDKPSMWGFLVNYFPPFFIQHGIELKSFISSKTFAKIRQRYGDLRAADAIYIRAMRITNDNSAVSLLLATFACFDHRLVGFKVPIFALFFPLSNESEQEFKRRVNNLPTKLYSDTPRGIAGDRDKLQHFFGSAFIAYTFESDKPAERFSDFIEKGEEFLLVGGVNDKRDIRANRHGQEFGLALLEDNHKLPSEFFISHDPSKFIADSSRDIKSVPQGVK